MFKRTYRRFLRCVFFIVFAVGLLVALTAIQVQSELGTVVVAIVGLTMMAAGAALFFVFSWCPHCGAFVSIGSACCRQCGGELE